MIIKKMFHSKSLTTTSTILISLVFLIVIGTITTLTYLEKRKDYYDQFNQLGKVFAAQMQANVDLVATAYDHLNNDKGGEDVAFDIMRRQLDAMVSSSTIHNAYLFMPDQVEVNGEAHYITMQSNTELAASGFMPGDEYEMEPYFKAGHERALKEGWALTEPFEDTLGKWVSYVAPIKDANGKVVALFGTDFDSDEVDKKLLSMLLRTVGISALSLAVAIIILLFVIRSAVAPLRRLAELSGRAAQGDLTVEVPVTSGNEIGQAAEAFNKMIVSLRQLAIQIRDNSSEVAISAVNLQDSAGQTAEATQEIVEAIQAVASGADTQLQSSQECQRAMMEMAAGIQRIAESSSVVSELASESAESANEGHAIMSKAVDQMRLIEQELQSSVQVIQSLKQLSDNIGEMTNMITDISTQTNLLALNASIEAARAGEHGKGFAVVAQEIRKLAERSKNSSDQISTILDGVGEYTTKAVESMESSMRDAKSGSTAASEAGEVFRAIVSSTQRVSEQVQEVSAASQQMSAGSEQIAASLDELERIASGSSNHSERVAASSEEQLASMQSIAGASEQLRSMADSLKQAIERFRV